MLRHPDPSLTSSLSPTVGAEGFQIRGSWKKVIPKKATSLSARMGFASFVHNGILYVAGGQRAVEGPHYRDLNVFNLEARDGWKSIASYPVSENITGELVGWQFNVYRGKAYLFNGRSVVDYFDVKTQKWGSISPSYSGRWPYLGRCTDYTSQLIDGKLYIFGGDHDEAALGCNLFMRLDLDKSQWKLLSGTQGPVASFDIPGPRKNASSWNDGKHIYIVFGIADRMSAMVARQKYGAQTPYGYDDVWRYDIDNDKWRKERVRGNSPCPRGEMSAVYHEKLDKFICFGGYSPSLPTQPQQQHEVFQYTYYADTFICEPSPSPDGPGAPPTYKWKQVLTRGFPTYRAQTHLVVDDTTGKTYLYGGYTNNEFVPNRRHPISRAFGDMWELRIDLPGGNFEGVDVDEEARTATNGHWKRCFSCGSAGDWRTCGGTCKGRANFCDPECLKLGWKEHKEMHSCKKAT